MKALVASVIAITACSSNNGTGHPDGGGSASGSTLAADAESIALDGAQVPKLLGATAIAAFRWDGSQFIEVASQVDPREVRPFADALAPDDPRRPITGAVTTSFYTDSNLAPGDGTTYVGVDSDPTFDRDDELVVLAKDFGGAAPSDRAPDGVDATTRSELRAAIGDARVGYLYLFTRATSSTPASSMTAHVAFTGATGDFKTFYRTNATDQTGASRGCGGGTWGVVWPEDTTIAGTSYERHFSGRWLSDEMRVIGAASHPDILDIHEVRPAFAVLSGDVGSTTAASFPTNSHACDRSAASFSGGPGTIVTLRGGPLRVIRTYFGANSGTITERTHLFYPTKEDIYTYVRVHPIAGVSDALDLSADAIGMTYTNEHNPAGLAIDGKADAFDRTLAHWELLSGSAQGALLSVHRRIEADLGALSTTTYAPQTMFLDAAAPTTCVCSGADAAVLGAAGPTIFAAGVGLPNTDPLRGDAGKITFVRSIYYSEGESDPATHAADALALTVSVDGGAAFDPYAVVCGDGVCEADETSANCDADCTPPAGAAHCGDGTCVDGENYVCTQDCPITGHAAYYACLDDQCASQYFSCASDPGCEVAMECVEACTDPYATCLSTCGAAITDNGSRDLAAALFQTCGTTPCGGEF